MVSRRIKVRLVAVVCLVAGAAICVALARPVAEGVRPPAVAGRFYPDDSQELSAAVRGFIDAAPAPEEGAGRAIALVAPHAGYAFSGPTAGAAFRWLSGMDVDRVVVIAVSHAAPSEQSVWIDDVAAYAIPGHEIEVDRKALKVLEAAGLPIVAGLGLDEHSLEVELPFLVEALQPGWKLVPILVGGGGLARCSEAARAIKAVLDNRTIVCVSSDFTHYGAAYGYRPFDGSHSEIAAQIDKLDAGAIDLILEKDAGGFAEYCGQTRATICGRGPIMVLLGLLPGQAVGRRVAYTTSAARTGDFSMSVSYAGIVFTVDKTDEDPWGTAAREDDEMAGRESLSETEKQTLLAIAHASLQSSVKRKSAPDAADFELTDALREKRGAFVTLTTSGSLRGCIGYVEPIEPLWRAVMSNAANAAMSDPRFPPVTEAELPGIRIEISAMSPLRRVTDVSEIEVGNHGIMISRGRRRGLLLPQVATEYGWDSDEFLRRTCEKAGLSDNAWKDDETMIEIFSAEVFGEDDNAP